jgi:hypothetical protein
MALSHADSTSHLVGAHCVMSHAYRCTHAVCVALRSLPLRAATDASDCGTGDARSGAQTGGLECGYAVVGWICSHGEAEECRASRRCEEWDAARRGVERQHSAYGLWCGKLTPPLKSHRASVNDVCRDVMLHGVLVQNPRCTSRYTLIIYKRHSKARKNNAL